jgi:rare lipoprotein A
MLTSKNVTPGSLTWARTALSIFAATFLVDGAISEASAKSHHHSQRHSHHYAHHTGHRHSHHHFAHSAVGGAWRDANAAISPWSGSGRSFSGMASYYGSESGSRTASGQRFNQNALTAAHRSLPFGTKLRVTHGGRSVVVTINDRGPFIRGRVLDLSTGAARAIGLTGAGVGRVMAEVI